MANNHFAHTREAVRVKVKKCEFKCDIEWRKFSVDPQITTLEVLYTILAKAFDIKSDFSIKYKAFDPAGNEIYLAVLSDWDLDAAFLRIHNLSIQTATEPCLILQIDVKPFTEIKEWDATAATATANATTIVAPSSGGSFSAAAGGAREIISPLQQSFGASQKYMQNMQTKLPGLIMNQMEKTFSIVQKAFNLSEETMASLPPRPPLSDGEFRLYLDALGKIQRTDDLRKVIFFGGIESSLRRVVWKHILNVYPSGMAGQQRMDYMRQKSEHYYKLRDTWKNAIKQGFVVGELAYVTSMVKKDVLRTDRLHPFYAGSDDNQNIAALFNILTTYALNHPAVSYCQGMSDIASPLLVTMNDEAQAYICFCAIMTRVKGNFMLDGIAMTQKFTHLTEALSFYDPEFWEYLKSQQADDLLFCYRWLLLELKREFPFEDALRMLEVQWSSLKYETNVDKELKLYEKEFVPILENEEQQTASPLGSSFGAPPISPSYIKLVKPRENAYTKFCALRRQSSSASLSSLNSSLATSVSAINALKLDGTKRLNHSLDDNATRRKQRNAAAKAHKSLDETKMLQLMNGIGNDVSAVSKDINLTTVENHQDDVENDEVFTMNNTNDDENYFNFLPTNPFKDDAQQHETMFNSSKTISHSNSTQSIVGSSKSAAKLFLSSSSSSNTEEELLNSDGAGDTCVTGYDRSVGGGTELTKSKSHPIPKSIAKLHNKKIISNYNAVSNIIAKQLVNATNVSESMKRVSSVSGGHFKDLKEKIAATSKLAASMSFDDNSNSCGSPSSCSNEKPQKKLVKNFNEFLNLASVNKNKLADKINSIAANNSNTNSAININDKLNSPTHALVETINKVTAADTTESLTAIPTTTTTATTITTTTITAGTTVLHPFVQQTKGTLNNSLDESDSSSIPDTTWSGSTTAATCIQQTNNLSSHSLHLELNSTSTGITPDRTPTFERKLNGSGKTSSFNSPIPNLPNDASLTPEDNAQDHQEYCVMNTDIARELSLEAENLDRQIFGSVAIENDKHQRVTATDIEYETLNKDSIDSQEYSKENEFNNSSTTSNKDLLVLQSSRISTNTNSNTNANVNITAISTSTTTATITTPSTTTTAAFTTTTTAFTTTTTAFTTTTSAHLKQTHQIYNITHINIDDDYDDDYNSITPLPATAVNTSFDSGPHINPFIDESLLFDTLPAVLPNSNSLPEVIVPLKDAPPVACPVEVAKNASDDITFKKLTQQQSFELNGDIIPTTTPTSMLPPPNEFGGGNPFLMFLCLTLLLQHRNTIIKSGMDYNEIAMHFDKMVRKHDVTRVLNQARRMYIDYLKAQVSFNRRKQQQHQQQSHKQTKEIAGDINKSANTTINNAIITKTITTTKTKTTNS